MSDQLDMTPELTLTPDAATAAAQAPAPELTLEPQAQEAYGQLSSLYGGVLQNGSRARPKAVFFDQAMSYSRITGIYFFMTFEPNINTDTPHYSIPYTICHEMAHACGFMREDEANYIAYQVSSQSQDPVGRKIDFLVQEMNREANTIGSKSVNSKIAYLVVDIKALIEKIREQVQNVE